MHHVIYILKCSLDGNACKLQVKILGDSSVFFFFGFGGYDGGGVSFKGFVIVVNF